MLNVILIMTFGILFGIAFRSKQKLMNIFNKSTLWIIFLLLFFLGVSVGGNPEIINNLGTIGVRGLQLAVASLLGTLVLAAIVYHLFFKSTENEG